MVVEFDLDDEDEEDTNNFWNHDDDRMELVSDDEESGVGVGEWVEIPNRQAREKDSKALRERGRSEL